LQVDQLIGNAIPLQGGKKPSKESRTEERLEDINSQYFTITEVKGKEKMRVEADECRSHAYPGC